MKVYDWLLVLNSDCSVLEIAKLNIKQSNVLVLSSCDFFKHEKIEIESVLDNSIVKWLVMSDLVMDCEAEFIDIISKFKNTGEDRYLYNELIKLKLRLTCNFSYDRVYAMNGLSIVSKVWESDKIRNNFNGVIKIFLNKAYLYLKNRLFLIFIINQIKTQSYVTKEKKYVIIGSSKRLNINSKVVLRASLPIYLHHFKFVTCLLNVRWFLYNKKFNLEAFCGYHMFDFRMKFIFKDLFIVSDGFFPPNYPVFDESALSGSKIIARYSFDEIFFNRVKCDVIKEHSLFYTYKELPLIKSLGNKVKTIGCAMNHAGDWSMLIDRSDTDRMVSLFIELAKAFYDLKFIIRFHPTMPFHMHDGINSLKRYMKFIELSGLKNLSVHFDELGDFILKTDLIISEYSDIIIEQAHLGKLVLAVNPTNRRSFVKDIGIDVVSNSKELISKFKYFV